MGGWGGGSDGWGGGSDVWEGGLIEHHLNAPKGLVNCDFLCKIN